MTATTQKIEPQPLIGSCRIVTGGSLKVYGQTLQTKISYDIPSVPADLRNISLDDYKATVVFGDKTKWIIHIWQWFGPADDEDWEPSILVYRVGPDVKSVTDPTKGFIEIKWSRDNKLLVSCFKSSELYGKFPEEGYASDFEKSATESLRTIVEYELSHL